MRYQFWPLRQITGSHFDAMPDLQVHTVLPAVAPNRTIVHLSLAWEAVALSARNNHRAFHLVVHGIAGP
jgi:hypothetical protein